MKNLFAVLTVVLTTFVMLAPEDADARRFGGGRSIGKQSPSFSRQATPPSRPQQAAPARSAQQPRSGMGRWLGPMLAGGLLGALFFGGAFEGIQFMDILIIVALVAGGFFLFRMMRRKAAAPGSAHAHHYAAAGPGGFRTPDIGSGLPGGGAAQPQQPAPSWFDEQRFVAAAKKHFVGLQKAWDSGDMEEIRETVTPDLFEELTRERRALGSERQYTEVARLDAELAGTAYEGDVFIASVRYNALIKEDPNGRPEPVTEVWHIQRSVNDPKANWYVAGIQQV
jgi:predicted lipid-binding transport protein (Tim44 family)